MKNFESPINLKTPYYNAKLLMNDESLILMIQLSPTFRTPTLKALILMKLQSCIFNELFPFIMIAPPSEALISIEIKNHWLFPLFIICLSYSLVK